MQKTSINPQIAQEMLDSARNAGEKGQSQFFTPIEFGQQLAAALPRYRGTIVDLNCGAAHLLHAASNKTTTELLGCDIDPCRSMDGVHITRITQDVTLVYPMLREIQFNADLFVLNPPWALEWHRDRIADLADSKLAAVRQAFKAGADSKFIDSTIATLLIALDLCSESGEGMLIANEATLRRLIFEPGAPHSAIAAHVWAHVVKSGNPMTGETHANWEDKDFKTGILYFARSHTTGPGPGLTHLTMLRPEDRKFRKGLQVFEHLRAMQSGELWIAARERIKQLQSTAPQWNLWLSGGVVQTHLSRFEQRSIKVDKNEAVRLHALQGKSPMQLVLQRNEREELVHVARDAGWRVQPELLHAIDEAIQQYHAARAPLYPLSKIKRLGYLDEQDCIVCEHDLALGKRVIFRKGRSYPIRTHTVNIERKAQKPNSVNGNLEDITYSGQELAIYISTDKDTEYSFLDVRLRDKDTKVAITKKSGTGIDFTLEELCEHFTIPDVPDVATVNPVGYDNNVRQLDEFERLTGSKLKLFQKEDLARAALHDGLIMGWDTGLGKTWTLFLFPLLKTGYTHLTGRIVPNGPVLVVAPGDLHQQICDEARRCFNIEVKLLDSQDTFHRLCRRPDSPLPKLTAEGRPIIPPEFYITSYTQLCTNNVNSLPDPDKWKPRALLDSMSLHIGDVSITETTHELNIPSLRSEIEPECVGWPESVSEFFALRCHTLLWKDDFALFDLDYRYANRARLDEAYEKAIEKLRDWPDGPAANNQRKRLDNAFGILSQIIPEQIAHGGDLSKLGIPDWSDFKIMACFADLSPVQQDFVIKQFCVKKLEDYSFNMSKTREYPIGPIPDGYDSSRPETDTRPKWRIKCVFNPSVADLSYNAFDAVSIDEGVKMKSEETLIGTGVRQMDPLYRNVATATPIKDRLPDIFRLAWWACGGRMEAHARFPYRDSSAERDAFSRTFLVQADIEGTAGDGSTYHRSKVTAEVCNVHRLWKLLGPIVLRRRKQDCAEDIVPRIKKIFRCKMGTEQRRVYEYHLKATYLDRNRNLAIGAQLQGLRQAAVAPATSLLLPQHGMPTESCPVCAKGRGKTEFEVTTSDRAKGRRPLGAGSACPKCDGAGVIPLPHRAASNYIPKIATVLSLVREILERKEQVIVFSAFNEPNDELGRLLGEAGVRYLILDGRTSPKKRGAAAAIFKSGRAPYTDAKGIRHTPIPVTLGGVDSVAEGHSFHLCNNVILFAYSWAYDKFKQALDRVHRLNSPVPVNVYVVFCDGTIDQRLESLTDEKGDAADLVLDGALMGERAEEVNFAELLKLAQREFKGESQTVDEAVLQSEWPALRDALANAQTAWDEGIVSQPIASKILRADSACQTPARKWPVPVLDLPAPLSFSNPWRNRLRHRAAYLPSRFQSPLVLAQSPCAILACVKH